MSDLDGILVMQNKLRVSDCNYGFVSKQGHPQTVGEDNAPSVRAFQSYSLHGVGTLRHPNSSGAVAINRTARTVAIRLLPALIWLSVRGSKRRASESGSPCAGVFVHTPEWGSLLGEAGERSPSHYLGLPQATALRPDRLIVPAGDNHPGGLTLAVLADAGAVSAGWLLPLCLAYGPYKDYESRLLNGSQCSYFVIVAILLTFVHESKPDSGQPLAEVGISHGHLRCSRSSGCNKDAFGRNDTVTVITPYINLRRVSSPLPSSIRPRSRPNCVNVALADRWFDQQGLSPRHSPWCR